MNSFELTIGDPKQWVEMEGTLKRLPFSDYDLAYFSYQCGEYEAKRRTLEKMKKLKGLEEEVVNGSS